MQEFDFRTEFTNKTILELIIIAQSDEYTPKARQSARTLLTERLGAGKQLQDAWRQELERLSDLCKKCHLCGADEVSYTSPPFFFCKSEGSEFDLLGSTVGLASFVAVGIGAISTKEQYQVVELTLNLCSQCKKRRTRRRLFGSVKVRLPKEDYYCHPLYELYGPLGFTELRFEQGF